MIQIIISPAKKMNICEEFPGTATTPVFAEQTDLLYQTLKQMSFEELQKLWKCSEKLALQNTKRLCEFTPADAVTPAVLAYEGIQYQYLAPGIFSDTQWEYVNRHLNILSGFYGVLCPSDAVIPYRLEMQTKLETENATDCIISGTISYIRHCTVNLRKTLRKSSSISLPQNTAKQYFLI